MRTLATLTRVEAALLAREPAAVAFTLLLPLILLVLNGSGGNAANPNLGGAGTVDVLMAGYLVYVIATSAIMGMAETLADYRDRGILRRMRITPLKPWQILGSHALTHAAMSAVGAGLLITVGVLAFDLNPPVSVLATLVALVAAAASLIALGFLLGAVLPSVRTTQAVAAAVYFPAIFVSGALFPTEVLPTFAQRLSEVLPMTYAVRIIREAWTMGTVDLFALGVCVVTAAVAVVIAIRFFRWESR